MARDVHFKEKDISVRVRKRRGMRRMTLSISADGGVSLTTARSTPLWLVERFLARQIEWIERTLHRLGISPQVKKEREASASDEYRRLKEPARALVFGRLAHWNEQYGFVFTSVSIRNQKSRWGSCSSAGRLSFNYRLVSLPPELSDYVLVHELCHLQELNHDPAFWELVAKTIPDFRARRAALKKLSLAGWHLS
ncbi:MAG: M48 family metallopeptidase [Candidatus Moraniibacteriota bacterium]